MKEPRHRPSIPPVENSTQEEKKSINPKTITLLSICEELIKIQQILQIIKRSIEEQYEQKMFKNIFIELIEILEGIQRLQIDEFNPKNPNDAQMVKENIIIIGRKIEQILHYVGIEAFSSLGKQYDPQFHQVIDKRFDPKLEPGTIVEEYQRGYWNPSQKQIIKRAQVVISTRERRRER